jgi:hypothetical protein
MRAASSATSVQAADPHFSFFSFSNLLALGARARACGGVGGRAGASVSAARPGAAIQRGSGSAGSAAHLRLLRKELQATGECYIRDGIAASLRQHCGPGQHCILLAPPQVTRDGRVRKVKALHFYGNGNADALAFALLAATSLNQAV